MSAPDKIKNQPWHLRLGRANFLRAMLLLTFGGYIFVFLFLALFMYIGNWIIPHLHWIPKLYVKDDPPLVAAFYSANFVGACGIILTLFGYIVGPDRQVQPLWP